MVMKGKIFICDRCQKETVIPEEYDIPADWSRHADITTSPVHFCPICSKEYSYLQKAFLAQMKIKDLPKEFMEMANNQETQLNVLEEGVQ